MGVELSCPTFKNYPKYVSHLQKKAMYNATLATKIVIA
jgi:hypothetical protein